MEILEWCGRHYLLAIVGLLIAENFVGAVYSRTLRAIMVSIKGWPPAHLDADGDWKSEPEAGEPT